MALRLRESVEIVSTVWHRALLDPLVAPARFRKMAPDFWRASNMLFHPGITSLDLGQLPASQENVQMLSVQWVPGCTPPQDLYAILRIVRWIRPRTIFEIGTFQGITTAHLALNSQAEIYTLDLPREVANDLRGYSPHDLQLLQPSAEIGRFCRSMNFDGRIRQLFGDSRTFDFAPYRGAMDLVVVDGCHVYDGVLQDSRNAFEMLSESGVILWHDFANLRDVTRAVHKVAKTHPLYHIEGTWLAMFVRGSATVRELQLSIGADKVLRNQTD